MPAFDSLTSRSPHGLTNAAPWQTMGSAGIPDPSWAHVYHNDFDTFNTGDWTITKVGTGTVALTPGDGGQLLMTNTTGTSDSLYLQLAAAGFKLVAGKQTFFKFAGALSAITNNVFYAGLAATGASPIDVSDGVYIYKASTSAALQLIVKAAGSSVIANFPELEIPAAATQFEIGISIDQQGNVAAYFNPTTGDNPISAASAASSQSRGRVVAVYAPTLPTVDLNVSFGLQNTTAVANTLTVDYVTAVRER